jgi:hypothetical protein
MLCIGFAEAGPKKTLRLPNDCGFVFFEICLMNNPTSRGIINNTIYYAKILFAQRCLSW